MIQPEHVVDDNVQEEQGLWHSAQVDPLKYMFEDVQVQEFPDSVMLDASKQLWQFEDALTQDAHGGVQFAQTDPLKN